MAEEQGTQNGNVEGPSSSTMAHAGDLVSTIELAPPEDSTADTSETDANNGDPDGKKTTGADDEAGQKDASGQKGDDDLDKHPRFVQLNERMKLAETRAQSAEARSASLETKVTELLNKTSAKDTQEETKYKDVSKMTSEEILDWQTEDPHGYYANILEQAKHEISGDMKQTLTEQSVEDAVASTYEKYAKENEDFDEMWDSGELKKYMDLNPGHNAISAHMAITSANKTKLKIDEAVKEAEKRIMANIKAKRENTVLSSGPSASRTSTESGIPEELKDTKKHGGLAAVLARRSLAREKARLGQ